jgi:hypothetical protein
MAKFSDISPPIEKAQTPFQTRGIPGKSADLADFLARTTAIFSFVGHCLLPFSNSYFGKREVWKLLKSKKPREQSGSEVATMVFVRNLS